LAAAPDDAPILKSSAQVSTGRFWGVLGRILLMTIGLGIAGSVVTGVTGGLGSPVDQDAVNVIVEVDGDDVFIRNFRFDDLLPSGSDLAGFLLISTVVGSTSSLISTSAFMRLYLDGGGPSEIT
jgi:hypothetical protein